MKVEPGTVLPWVAFRYAAALINCLVLAAFLAALYSGGFDTLEAEPAHTAEPAVLVSMFIYILVNTIAALTLALGEQS